METICEYEDCVEYRARFVVRLVDGKEVTTTYHVLAHSPTHARRSLARVLNKHCGEGNWRFA